MAIIYLEWVGATLFRCSGGLWLMNIIINDWSQFPKNMTPHCAVPNMWVHTLHKVIVSGGVLDIGKMGWTILRILGREFLHHPVKGMDSGQFVFRIIHLKRWTILYHIGPYYTIIIPYWTILYHHYTILDHIIPSLYHIGPYYTIIIPYYSYNSAPF